MRKERRKHVRVKAPTVSIAAITGDTLSAAVGRGVLFGRIYDIDPDGMCATMDTELPVGKSMELILRLFKMDLRFSVEIIRSDKSDTVTFVAFSFDWEKTPSENKVFLEQFLASA
jgi:hypothetical protein